MKNLINIIFVFLIAMNVIQSIPVMRAVNVYLEYYSQKSQKIYDTLVEEKIDTLVDTNYRTNYIFDDFDENEFDNDNEYVNDNYDYEEIEYVIEESDFENLVDFLNEYN